MSSKTDDDDDDREDDDSAKETKSRFDPSSSSSSFFTLSYVCISLLKSFQTVAQRGEELVGVYILSLTRVAKSLL